MCAQKMYSRYVILSTLLCLSHNFDLLLLVFVCILQIQKIKSREKSAASASSANSVAKDLEEREQREKARQLEARRRKEKKKANREREKERVRKAKLKKAANAKAEESSVCLSYFCYCRMLKRIALNKLHAAITDKCSSLCAFACLSLSLWLIYLFSSLCASYDCYFHFWFYRKGKRTTAMTKMMSFIFSVSLAKRADN